MQFREFLKQSAQEIDLEIQTFLDDWSKETVQTAPLLKPHIQALKDASAGGKRIRGALVILGYALVSKNANPEILKIAAAYELFQTAILAHDDIIDKSPARRGKPSLYMALGGGEYGIAQALCLGDIGFFLAYKRIVESTFDEALKNKACVFFTNSIIQTTVGEMLDVELAHKKTDALEKDILAVTRLKTAYYTFVAPLTLGALLAGAEDTLVADLTMYGEALGIAFQLQDDIHDVFGTETSLKKKVGGDIAEGKQTMLFKKAKEKANAKQKQILKNYYGTHTVGEKEINEIKKVFEQTGALEYTHSLAKKYSKTARTIIPSITSDENMKNILNEIIDYVI